MKSEDYSTPAPSPVLGYPWLSLQASGHPKHQPLSALLCGVSTRSRKTASYKLGPLPPVLIRHKVSLLYLKNIFALFCGCCSKNQLFLIRSIVKFGSRASQMRQNVWASRKLLQKGEPCGFHSGKEYRSPHRLLSNCLEARCLVVAE